MKGERVEDEFLESLLLGGVLEIMNAIMQKQVVKERPIIFSSEMARAILEGRKTQTRRVVKLSAGADPYLSESKLINPQSGVVPCPYGLVGDRLWVRERHRITAFESGRARVEYSDGLVEWITAPLPVKVSKHYRSSIHMPRWAARIVLEITNIRVERLLTMTHEDAKAEGIEMRFHPDDPELLTYKDYSWHCERFAYGSMFGARESFLGAWDLINAKRGYPAKSDPYVWAITFKVIQPIATTSPDTGSGETGD